MENNSPGSPLPPPAQIMQLAMGYMIAQAVAVAAKMKLADELSDGPKSAEEIAAATDSHAPSVYRLLRALVSAGLFVEHEDRRFSNNEVSDFLRSDHPESLRDITEMMGNFEHWSAHGNMFHSIKTGGIAFDHTFGMSVFPFFAANPESAKIFDAGMTSFSSSVAKALVEAYDFSSYKTIADIGGGHGLVLDSILEKAPDSKGILFDQPQVVEGAHVRHNVEIVGGDFFTSIPVNADLYVMKFIIHDWNDEQSVTILSNLAKSAPSGSKLLLLETVIEENSLPSMSKVMDLNMLVITGGRERTATEYSRLLEASGFKLTNILPTKSPLQIVEAVRV